MKVKQSVSCGCQIEWEDFGESVTRMACIFHLVHVLPVFLGRMLDLICQEGFLGTIHNIKPRCCLTVNEKYIFPPAFCSSIRSNTPILAEAKQVVWKKGRFCSKEKPY